MDLPQGRKITIMHACQWDLFRKGVKLALEKRSEIEFIGDAKNGKDLMDLLDQRRPDVVILDISMPIMDGIQTLSLIKHRFPSVKVIMLTMHNDPEMILRTLENGANGYLTADTESEDIYNAILSSFGPGIYFSKSARQSLNPSFESLKAKEVKLIRSLANNVSEEKIAQELDLSVRTIRVIIDRLLKAARVSTVEELVMQAREKGYVET
jgi:two-component system nitrate/nitrite response regulator NarL